jgi:hypothetical protein
VIWLLYVVAYLVGVAVSLRYWIHRAVVNAQETADRCRAKKDDPWQYDSWDVDYQLLVSMGSIGWPFVLLYFTWKNVLVPSGMFLLFPVKRTRRDKSQARRLLVQQHQSQLDSVIARQQAEILDLHQRLEIPYPGQPTINQ